MSKIKSYLNDYWIKWLLSSALLINLALFFFLYFFIKQTNLPATLHYNVYWGVDYLGELRQLLYLPIVGFIILALNTIFGLALWLKNSVLPYFFVSAAFIVQIFLSIAGAALYLINK